MTPPNPHDGSWASVNWSEVMAAIAGSAIVGLIRTMELIRRGREFRWIDIILEPCMAVIAGMMVWAAAESVGTPDVFKAMLVSLGAWGGPKTIQYLEIKYLGGRRSGDTLTRPADLR